MESIEEIGEEEVEEEELDLDGCGFQCTGEV